MIASSEPRIPSQFGSVELFITKKGPTMSDIDDFEQQAQASSETVDRFLDDLAAGRDPGSQNPSAPVTGVDPDLSRGSESTGSSGSSTAADAMGQAREKGEEMADKAREKGQEVAGMAQEKADEGLNAAASGLGQAADKLREQGSQHGGTVGNATAKTADALDTASTYLRDKDSEQMLSDLEELIRRKPVETLLAAAGIGFVVARLLR